jgi:CheY-like chemotaxis protein
MPGDAASQAELMTGESSGEPKIYDLDAPVRRTAHLLLLDDEGDFTALLTTILEAHGYLVTVVGNAADGIKKLMYRDFDGIICDMMMPGLPGDMFYLAVERTKPHLCNRFVFITGEAGDEKINEFLAHTKAPVLRKPFKSPALLEALRTIVEKAG